MSSLRTSGICGMRSLDVADSAKRNCDSRLDGCLREVRRTEFIIGLLIVGKSVTGCSHRENFHIPIVSSLACLEDPERLLVVSPESYRHSSAHPAQNNPPKMVGLILLSLFFSNTIRCLRVHKTNSRVLLNSQSSHQITSRSIIPANLSNRRLSPPIF
jgi:hypothetical protein